MRQEKRRRRHVAELPLITAEREYLDLLEAGGIDFDPNHPPEGVLRHAWDRVRVMRKAQEDLVRGAQMNPSRAARKRAAWWQLKAEAIFLEMNGEDTDDIVRAIRKEIRYSRSERTVRDFLGTVRKRTRA